MKPLLLAAVFFFAASIYCKSQNFNITKDTIQVILENNKLKVTEYSSMPGKDVCGKRKHTHAAHLSILLTDAMVRVTTPDGKIRDFDLKSGATFWSEPETHIAVNNGNMPAKVYIVEIKKE
jgi:hypothetical protein